MTVLPSNVLSVQKMIYLNAKMVKFAVTILVKINTLVQKMELLLRDTKMANLLRLDKIIAQEALKIFINVQAITRAL